MFVFAILYFGIMTDAGMLDPIVDRHPRAVGTKPTRIVMGSALLALLVHLDGSGRGDVSRHRAGDAAALRPAAAWTGAILACVASMAAGVNFLPWTGPMLRASAGLHISTTDLFRPLIPVQIVGLDRRVRASRICWARARSAAWARRRSTRVPRRPRGN